MKLYNVKDVKGLFETVNDCEGSVEMVLPSQNIDVKKAEKLEFEQLLGTKHLYPLTKIRNCNCIYNFWRPSHMRGGFLFPDIRVERDRERFSY